MADERGLYRKFTVYRTDGDPDNKHDGCRYFVLDIDHDAHAIQALHAYAADCEQERPALARDIRIALGSLDPGATFSALMRPDQEEL